MAGDYFNPEDIKALSATSLCLYVFEFIFYEAALTISLGTNFLCGKAISMMVTANGIKMHQIMQLSA